MTKIFTIIITVLFVSPMYAQDIIDFESFGIEQDTFLDGSDLSGGFQINDVFLPNNYNQEFASWVGWAISSKTDTVTTGFTNQYSSIAGSGVENSNTFALSFNFEPNGIQLDEDKQIDGFYVTNNTYAYFSMLEGDDFAKKFGGETGDDPDYFLLTISGFKTGQQVGESIDFYLADYRFEDPSEDYIIKDWTYVDISMLGETDSLSFELMSSDVGEFGVNTPTYFCIDNIIVNTTVPTIDFEEDQVSITIFPNPASEMLHIEGEKLGQFSARLYNSNGTMVEHKILNEFQDFIDVSSFSSGLYQLVMQKGTQLKSVSIVIQ